MLPWPTWPPAPTPARRSWPPSSGGDAPGRGPPSRSPCSTPSSSGWASTSSTPSTAGTIEPYGPFRCGDGVVYIGVQNQREWARLCERVLGDPQLAADERFSALERRRVNRAALLGEIESRLAGRTRAALLGELDAAGIAGAAYSEVADIARHPQLEPRDRWREVALPGGSSVRAALPPATFLDGEAAMGPVPALGQHTEAVLREIGLA